MPKKAMPKKKTPTKKAKPGRKEERLVIEEDPTIALARLLNPPPKR